MISTKFQIVNLKSQSIDNSGDKVTLNNAESLSAGSNICYNFLQIHIAVFFETPRNDLPRHK